MKSASKLMKFVLSAIMVLFALPSFAGDWQRVQASYEAPVPKELAAYANFEMHDLRWRVRDGLQEVHYTLPVELTGRVVEIHTRSVDGGKTFKGPIGEMDCRASAVDCKVHYPTLRLNADEVKAKLQSMGIQGDELNARMNVHQFFAGGDIIGFIHIKK